jgi:hypothetical protein
MKENKIQHMFVLEKFNKEYKQLMHKKIKV